MTKQEFLKRLEALYIVGNRADNEARHAHGEDWTAPSMAGKAFCQHIDAALHAMVHAGVLTDQELETFYLLEANM